MGYGSLFEFCMEYLGYSRSSAGRRISAARCIDRFPPSAEPFRSGEVNLCALSMISGILTSENAGEILSWVRGRPFRDVEMLVARHRPEKIIRDRVKPVFVMKPAPAGNAVNAPGCVNAPSGGDTANPGSDVGTKCTLHRTFTPNIGSEKFPKSKFNITGMAVAGNTVGTPGAENTASVPGGAAEPERVVVEKKFKIEFAVEPAFMRDLERARILLSTKHPKGIGLETLFGTLLKEYLERHDPKSRIEKRRQRCENKKKRDITNGKTARDKKRTGGDDNAECGDQGEAGNQCSGSGDHGDTGKKAQKHRSVARTRHIPQSIRDEVFVRDGGRCTFTGTDGRQCEETKNLEIDHSIPYAKGGSNSPENLRLLCPAHNRLAAEKEYGKDHMKKFYKRE
jgi:hypothetical protein